MKFPWDLYWEKKAYRLKRSICTTDKRHSGTKFTSPEFCLPFSQTVRRLVWKSVLPLRDSFSSLMLILIFEVIVEIMFCNFLVSLSKEQTRIFSFLTRFVKKYLLVLKSYPDLPQTCPWTSATKIALFDLGLLWDHWPTDHRQSCVKQSYLLLKDRCHSGVD